MVIEIARLRADHPLGRAGGYFRCVRGRIPDIADRFTGLQTETLVTGAPLIVGGLAWMDCRVVQTFDAG
jgi:flavin reductase (DIM6/NTAB) family NADH-FMN oxidoreductase RutF